MQLSELWKKENYTVELITVYSPQFVDKITNLYGEYSIRGNLLCENYKPDKIRHCFASGRFKHGFFITRYLDKIVMTLGVDDFHGWGVLSRYVRHSYDNSFVPYGYGITLPFVATVLDGKVIGVCYTQNKTRKDLTTSIQKRYREGEMGNEMRIAAAESISKIKKLSYDVFYRDTIQTAYIYNTTLTPPFTRADTVTSADPQLRS